MSAVSHAEAWARLAAAGIVQGEAPASRLRSPWYVRVMQGGSGWLAALFLLSFAGGVFYRVLEYPPAALAMGLLACAGAALAFRRWPEGDFAAQLGFAVSLAGQAMIAEGLWHVLGGGLGAFAMAMAVVTALLFALAPNHLHRIWCAWSTAVCVWLALFDAKLGALVPGVLAGAMAWLWLGEATLARHGERARAAGWGLALAVVQFPLVDVALDELGRLAQTAPAHRVADAVAWAGAGLSAGVLVGLTGWVLAREGRAPGSGPGLVALAGAAVVALLGLKAPGLAPATIVLVVGFAAGSRELAGLGVLALLAYLAHYYYALDVTLLEKSLWMAGAGGALLLAWLVLRRLWPHAGEVGDA